MAPPSADTDEISKLLLAAERLRLVRRAAKRFYMLGKLEREMQMTRHSIRNPKPNTRYPK
jgi:hypothetical protein